MGFMRVARVVALTALALLAACNSAGPTASPAGTPPADGRGEPREASATATTGSPSTGEVGRDAVAGLPVRQWKVNPPQPLPADMLLYLEKGCVQCDVGPNAIERVWTGGSLHTETLFSEPGEPAPYIRSWTMDAHAGHLVVSMCSRGYCGGTGPMSATATSTLYESRDGGVTWDELRTYEGSVAVVALDADAPVLVRWQDTVAGGLRFEFFAYPDGPLLSPPADEAFPSFSAGRADPLWLMPDGLTFVWSNGDVAFPAPDLAEPPPHGMSIVGAPDRSGSGFLVRWVVGANGNARSYSGYVRNGKLEAVYAMASWEPAPGAWLDDNTAVGTSWLFAGDLPGLGLPADFHASVPVLIDFAKGEITPLEVYGPLSNAAAYERPGFVRALRGVIRGTFYRVATGGECLNVRERPSRAARSLGCYAEGVLLRAQPAEIANAEGLWWAAMEAPDGSAGWAALQFLER